MNTTYTLITGASGGIGYSLAKAAASDHKNLILAARSGEKLETLAGELRSTNKVDVITAALDLTENTGVEKLLSLLKDKEIVIETLINNAGFADFSDFAEADLHKNLEMIRLNIATLTHLTHHCLQGMKKVGSGRIMNVASTAAFMPGPGMAVYYATKAYVLSFSEALSRELKGSGIAVTALCPGPTDTGFAETAGLGKSLLNRLLPRATATDVAMIGYKAMLNGKTLVVPGFMNKLSVMTPRFLPRAVIRSLIYNIHKKH
jgi:uncharacterized protein